MALDFKRARELCTQAELSLVESTRPSALRSLSSRALRLKVRRARGLRDKFRDLAVRQARDARAKDRATGRARVVRRPLRTQAKAQLFEDVLGRFEARAAELGVSQAPAVAPPLPHARGAARPKEDRRRRARSETSAAGRKARKLKTIPRAAQAIARVVPQSAKPGNSRLAVTEEVRPLRIRKTSIFCDDGRPVHGKHTGNQACTIRQSFGLYSRMPHLTLHHR